MKPDQYTGNSQSQQQYCAKTTISVWENQKNEINTLTINKNQYVRMRGSMTVAQVNRYRMTETESP